MPKYRTKTILIVGLIELLVIGGIIWYVWGRPQQRAERLAHLGKVAQQHGWKGTGEWFDKAATDVRTGQAITLSDLLRKSEERLTAGKAQEAEDFMVQALQGSKGQKPKTEGDLRREVGELQQIAKNEENTDIKALASYLTVRKKLALAEKEYSSKVGPALHTARYAARKNAADSAAAAAERFPKSYWASKALLLAATQHAMIGEKALAKQEFQKLVKEYPKTPAAKEAQRRLMRN